MLLGHRGGAAARRGGGEQTPSGAAGCGGERGARLAYDALQELPDDAPRGVVAAVARRVRVGRGVVPEGVEGLCLRGVRRGGDAAGDERVEEGGVLFWKGGGISTL